MGVTTVVQWVKNLTAAAWVAMEVQAGSLPRCSGLKYPVLPQLWCRSQLWRRSQLWLGFSPWPGNFHMLCMFEKGKKRQSLAECM